MKAIKQTNKILILLIFNFLFLTSCNKDSNEEKETIDLFPSSTILDSQQKINLSIMYGDENQIWKKLYKATDDGFTALSFHTNCDNKGRTITIIKLENGFVLGGYNSNSWKSAPNSYVGSPSNFLFSISNNKKYMIKDEFTGNASYNSETYGPTFGGGHDLKIDFNNNSYCDPFSYDYNGLSVSQTNLEFTGIESDETIYFNFIDIEIWAIN